MGKIKKLDDFIIEKYGIDVVDGVYYRNGVRVDEMAYARRDFVLYMTYHLTTIAAHYVLLKYASEHKGCERLVAHWRGELESKIVDVREMDTKPRTNNRRMVKGALEQGWNESDCAIDTQRLARKIAPKLKEENVSVGVDDMSRYIRMFVNDMPTMIDLMAHCDDGISVDAFLDGICPNGEGVFV